MTGWLPNLASIVSRALTYRLLYLLEASLRATPTTDRPHATPQIIRREKVAKSLEPASGVRVD